MKDFILDSVKLSSIILGKVESVLDFRKNHCGMGMNAEEYSLLCSYNEGDLVILLENCKSIPVHHVKNGDVYKVYEYIDKILAFEKSKLLDIKSNYSDPDILNLVSSLLNKIEELG